MDASIGELVTAGSTADTALKLRGSLSGNINHLILVKSGTVKFGVNSVHANANGYGVDEKIVITCQNGELHFQAASATDTFVVTA